MVSSNGSAVPTVRCLPPPPPSMFSSSYTAVDRQLQFMAAAQHHSMSFFFPFFFVCLFFASPCACLSPSPPPPGLLHRAGCCQCPHSRSHRKWLPIIPCLQTAALTCKHAPMNGSKGCMWMHCPSFSHRHGFFLLLPRYIFLTWCFTLHAAVLSCLVCVLVNPPAAEDEFQMLCFEFGIELDEVVSHTSRTRQC